MVVEFLRPTENPDRRPTEVATSNILVKTFMTNKNTRGEIGPPWRRPLEAEKKSVGEPLASIAKEVEEMDCRIQVIHVSPNPILLKT